MLYTWANPDTVRARVIHCLVGAPPVARVSLDDTPLGERWVRQLTFIAEVQGECQRAAAGAGGIETSGGILEPVGRAPVGDEWRDADEQESEAEEEPRCRKSVDGLEVTLHGPPQG
jgi:hypothetical protein